MDEHQALLGRSVRPSLFGSGSEVERPARESYPEKYNVAQGAGDCNDGGGVSASSSDVSDSSSWDDFNYSCSSCSGSTHSSEDEWEECVTVNGEVLYIEPAKSASETNKLEASEPVSDVPVVGMASHIAKSFTDKQGKFVRWIRRRESKRLRPRLSVAGGSSPSAGAGRTDEASASGSDEVRRFSVTVFVSKLSHAPDLASLGLCLENNTIRPVVRSLHPEAPLQIVHQVRTGDAITTFNGEDVSLSILLERVKALNTPCQVVLGFQRGKTADAGSSEARISGGGARSRLESNPQLQQRLAELPCAAIIVDIGDSAPDADTDLVFCYPPNSKLAAGRGAFVTLNHLLPSVTGSECKSCTMEVDGEAVHVVFHSEDSLLLLLALPDRVCRVEEAKLIVQDIVTCLSFSHQTLQCCFRKEEGSISRFFSNYLGRLLSCGSRKILDIPLNSVDRFQHHFHEFLPEAEWVALPREAQLQLDDALNELEACDFGLPNDGAMQSNRQYIILGSCLYHQGYLLASHLFRQDLLDVHSLLRAEGVLDLSRSEGVARMVMWREVFPNSVNRGLPPSSALTAPSYPPPVGRWFLLVVSTGHDLLAAILENAGCCVALPSRPRPSAPLVREAEETLAHVQGLGLTSLAAQWLAARLRPATTATASTLRPPQLKATLRSTGYVRGNQGQEDTFSQAPSNLSNPSNPSNASNASESDENAPILGRRAERSGLSAPTAAASAPAAAHLKHLSDDSQSDSSDSDSDWGSFKGLGINDASSGIFDNPYLPSNVGDLDEITPTKITTGPENQLFHLVCVDGNSGVVVTSAATHDSRPPSRLMAGFTEAAHRLHSQLQHHVRVRADHRAAPAKSLSVVKECGVLIHPGDAHKPHWVVGRLFFTPKPREIYVCYSDDAPQNILEIAFRAGLGMAG